METEFRDVPADQLRSSVTHHEVYGGRIDEGTHPHLNEEERAELAALSRRHHVDAPHNRKPPVRRNRYAIILQPLHALGIAATLLAALVALAAQAHCQVTVYADTTPIGTLGNYFGLNCGPGTTIVNGTINCVSSGGGGTPGGADTQVQFNCSGSFCGDGAFVWDYTNHRLGIGVASPASGLDVSTPIDINGVQALWIFPDGGDGSFALGSGVLTAWTSGVDNLGTGNNSLHLVTDASFSTMYGNAAGQGIIHGSGNTGMGTGAVGGDGCDNTGIGPFTLFFLLDGCGNIAIGTDLFGSGSSPLVNVAHGNNSIGIGGAAGQSVVDGNGNILIGPTADTIGNTDNSFDLNIGDLIVGSLPPSGTPYIGFLAGGASNHAACWRADGTTMGNCIDAPDSGGICTCN